MIFFKILKIIYYVTWELIITLQIRDVNNETLICKQATRSNLLFKVTSRTRQRKL